MHVGQHGQAGVFGQTAQDARAFDQARAAKALHAGAVGLVVAGLEDVGNAEVGGDALNGLGHARAWASDSMTQGPAMRKSRPAPTWTGPISKELLTAQRYNRKEGPK
jgi:hypothetical protein